MPILEPENVQETNESYPDPPFCDSCKSNRIYFGDPFLVKTISIHVSSLEPKNVEELKDLFDLHPFANAVFFHLVTNEILTPYYIHIRLTDDSLTPYYLICNDCWENLLIDMLKLFPEEIRGQTKLVLSDRKTWWTYIRDDDEKSDPNSRSDKNGGDENTGST